MSRTYITRQKRGKLSFKIKKYFLGVRDDRRLAAVGALGEGIVVFDGREVVGQNVEAGVEFLRVAVIQQAGGFCVVAD